MTTASDDFNRADGDPGANWTALYTSRKGIISGNSWKPNDNTNSAGMLYSGASFAGADQYSKATIGGTFSSTSYASVGVFMSGASGTRNGYKFSCNTVDWYITRDASGTGTDIDTGTGTFAAGDVIELRIVSGTLTAYKNGVAITGASIADATYTSGSPSLEMYPNAGNTATLDNWEGGDFGAAQSQAPRSMQQFAMRRRGT
jgi:hypothetical protein